MSGWLREQVEGVKHPCGYWAIFSFPLNENGKRPCTLWHAYGGHCIYGRKNYFYSIENFAVVLVLVTIEQVFFIVGCVGLCFGSALKAGLLIKIE